jgi:predicted AlkP superfamily phosphohydrolase/phosphomutase
MHNSRKPKVVILGIDGVPCSLLRDFTTNNVMPNLSSLLREGTLSEMYASIPEVSSTSWTTFMTGVNPGKHNIYGFMELRPYSYKFYFPNSDNIKSDTIWDILGRNGKRSIVINVPSTYPAKPLNGMLTAGFVSLDLQKATYPDEAYQYLRSINYRMDVESHKASQSLELLAEDIDSTFKTRREAILHFYDNEEWDLFIGTITETDRLHHFLWSALEDSSHPLHGFFTNFYRQVDNLIGELTERCAKDTFFFIVSDHGFTAIKQEVYLNSFLKEMGFLRFKKEQPESLEDIHPESTAFALDPSRIYINTKDRYPSGKVEQNHYEDNRVKVKEALLNLRIDGEKVIKEVFKREELYKGPYFNAAPDLIALANTGFDLKGQINKSTVYGKSIFTGAHTHDNATFFINRTIKKDTINIIDIAPTVLNLMGINHADFDGKSYDFDLHNKGMS